MSAPRVRCKFEPVPRPAPGRSLPDETQPLGPIGPSRAARMLALAHHVEQQIDAGVLADYATAADALGLTRARLTQVMNLLLLAPEIQERIAVGELRASERELRSVSAEPEWNKQIDLIQENES